MDANMRQIGRLAMREEGTLWVAYYATADTMDGALFLGSIRMAGVIDSPARRERFMGMMRDMISDILRAQLGTEPAWSETRPAPEHERGGNA